MKTGVEDSNLRHWPQQFRDNLHALQFSPIVEWRKNGDAFDSRLDFGGHHRRQEILRTAVHHPMSYNVDLGRAGNRLRFAAPQAQEQALKGVPARPRRWKNFLSRSSAGVLDRVFRLAIGPLNPTLPNTIRRIVR